MIISEVSKICKIPAKTIRFYEDKQLIPPPDRKSNGYRYYSESHIKNLIFLKHIRNLGFSLTECQQLVNLLNNPNRKSSDVRDCVSNKLAEIEVKMKEMSKTRRLLLELIEYSQDNDEAECSIIDRLSSHYS
ncbi:MerR family transcriptional regulator [Pontibacterium granulatum]|uniref:MerR family transcriptional regulator n=1 Tax=Pontibacterium granulatum TaxID=2036029 RepID=UPI003CE4AA2E